MYIQTDNKSRTKLMTAYSKYRNSDKNKITILSKER